MKKYVQYLIVILFFISVILGILILIQQPYQEKGISFTSAKYPIKDKIAVVELYGEIYFTNTAESFLKRDVEYYVSKIQSLFKRKDVKGIIIKLNSPGGTVAAVQRLYNEILKLKKTYAKPIVCYVPELCASGGYYVAAACDRIICAEGSVVGSIGVLLQVGNISALLKKIGVNVEVIKSSKYKDIGSMFRDMLPEERQVLENLVNAAFEQFIDAIIKGRGMSREQVMKFADGKIYIANEAVKLQMVDKIGDEDTAVEEVKTLAGIKGEVEVIKERVRPFDFLRQVMIEMYLYKFKQATPLQKFVDKKFRFEYIFE